MRIVEAVAIYPSVTEDSEKGSNFDINNLFLHGVYKTDKASETY